MAVNYVTIVLFHLYCPYFILSLQLRFFSASLAGDRCPGFLLYFLPQNRFSRVLIFLTSFNASMYSFNYLYKVTSLLSIRRYTNSFIWPFSSRLLLFDLFDFPDLPPYKLFLFPSEMIKRALVPVKIKPLVSFLPFKLL